MKDVEPKKIQMKPNISLHLSFFASIKIFKLWKYLDSKSILLPNIEYGPCIVVNNTYSWYNSIQLFFFQFLFYQSHIRLIDIFIYILVTLFSSLHKNVSMIPKKKRLSLIQLNVMSTH